MISKNNDYFSKILEISNPYLEKMFSKKQIDNLLLTAESTKSIYPKTRKTANFERSYKNFD